MKGDKAVLHQCKYSHLRGQGQDLDIQSQVIQQQMFVNETAIKENLSVI